MKKFFIGICVTLLGVCISTAQMVETSATVGVVRDSMAIGDTVTLWVDITKDQGRYIAIPHFKDGMMTKDIEILQGPFLDSLGGSGDREKMLRLRYVVTVFEAQNIVVDSFPVLQGNEPPFDTIYARGGDVLMVGTYAIDTTQDSPVDIRQIMAAPKYSWGEFVVDIQDFFVGYWWAVLVGVLLGAVGLWMYFRHKNREYRQMIKRLPPHILAIMDLEKISGQKLWQSGQIKEYFSAITDTLRLYMERRWGVNAMEMTSAETLQQLEKLELKPKLMVEMKELFGMADMAKFARAGADPTECEQAYYNAYEFVEQTKLQTEETTQTQQNAQKEGEHKNE